MKKRPIFYQIFEIHTLFFYQFLGKMPKLGAEGTILENFGNFLKHLRLIMQKKSTFQKSWVRSENFPDNLPKSFFESKVFHNYCPTQKITY